MMLVFTVVSKYVEVDARHCAGVIPGLKTNQVCGRKIGSTDVEAVCKAGHGGTNCDGMSQYIHWNIKKASSTDLAYRKSDSLVLRYVVCE